MLSSAARQIILKNFSENRYCLSKEQVAAKVANGCELFYLKNDDGSCGDFSVLLVRRDGDYFKEISFTRNDICLVTTAFINILCSWVLQTNKSKLQLLTLLNNFEKMLSGSTDCNLEQCPDLTFFNHLTLVNRRSCVEVVVKLFKIIATN